MSALADETTPPFEVNPVWARLRSGLFGSLANAAVTLATVALLVWLVPALLRWTILDAVWFGSEAECAAADGACWAFIGAKIRFFLFAFYPPELHWRPALVILLLLALLAVTAMPRFWHRGLLALWTLIIVAAWFLMSGTFGEPVSTAKWGGLPITLLVWTVGFAGSLPLAVGLALARRSRMGGLRTLAIAYIEFMRATPMVAILYVATLILPMALPAGYSIEKTIAATIMIGLFWSAYTAEVVRGGLQVIPHGQEEAAKALGLGYWRTMQLIVLPQALRVVIPGLVNLAIGFFLATSLLAVIGIFDLLNAARASATDPEWLGYYDEAYIVVALIYFGFGYGGSRYSRWLERRLSAGERR